MGRTEVRRWALVGMLAYCALLGVALLAPTSGTQSEIVGWFGHGWLTPVRAEFACNILAVVPVTALGSALWPRPKWWAWALGGLVGATLVELIQGILLPHRSPTVVDVVANTLGALLGAVAVDVLRRRRR